MEEQDEEALSDTVDLREMLQLQLSEVEMLCSMFPKPGELRLDDDSVLGQIQLFVGGDINYEYLESRIGFVVNIEVEGSKASGVEMVCRLPHEYPALAPEVFVRAPSMTRDQHRQLGEDIQEFVVSLDRGDICLGSVIQWVQEHVSDYMTEQTIDSSQAQLQNVDNVFTRLWIFSHHIYSKFKRRDILAWASELKLTGFSLPGKPGMICAEGLSQAVDDYWLRLRRLNWKRLAIKEKEDFEIPPDNSIDNMRTFKTFEEIAFDVRGGKGREYHMDLGQLFNFLDKHNFGHIFSLYFGVEGTTKAPTGTSETTGS